ncbi:hypothetical protein HDU97_003883 [Phlyctochytrium planicorne]|nr:hypothetical protein HDU97_003883 [Phlyctochytrium planicorne]
MHLFEPDKLLEEEFDQTHAAHREYDTMQNQLAPQDEDVYGYSGFGNEKMGLVQAEKAMDVLTKENFNLKLRIFFLEEKLEFYAAQSEGTDHSHVLARNQEQIVELLENIQGYEKDIDIMNVVISEKDLEIERLQRLVDAKTNSYVDCRKTLINKFQPSPSPTEEGKKRAGTSETSENSCQTDEIHIADSTDAQTQTQPLSILDEASKGDIELGNCLKDQAGEIKDLQQLRNLELQDMQMNSNKKKIDRSVQLDYTPESHLQAENNNLSEANKALKIQCQQQSAKISSLLKKVENLKEDLEKRPQVLVQAPVSTDTERIFDDYRSLKTYCEDQDKNVTSMEKHIERLRHEENGSLVDEELWICLLEEERTKWRKDIAALESKTHSLQDQVEGMETAVAERELEIQRLRELLQHASTKLKDPKFKSDLLNLKAANNTLADENAHLKDLLNSLQMEKDTLTTKTSDYLFEIRELTKEVSERNNQVTHLQTSFQSAENEKNNAIEAMDVLTDFDSLRENFQSAISSALAIKEQVLCKVEEVELKYSSDMRYSVESESNSVLLFAEKVASFKAKYRSLKERSLKLHSTCKALRASEKDWKSRVEFLEDRERKLNDDLRHMQEQVVILEAAQRLEMQSAFGSDSVSKNCDELRLRDSRLLRLQDELRAVKEVAAKDQRLASERVEELLEEQRHDSICLIRQIDMLEKHCKSLRDQKVQLKLSNMDPKDYEHTLTTNEKLRADFQEMRKTLEQKEYEMESLRLQVSKITSSLEHSRKKAMAREERYKKTILSAIGYLEVRVIVIFVG